MVEQPPLNLGAAMKAFGRCALRTAMLLAQRRLRQPRRHVGQCCRFADGTTARVYRETVIDRPPPEQPVVLVISFRLRHVRSPLAHALFRAESLLNTVLFAGFPGLISKLWFAHDDHDVYRGLYDWDDPVLAESYVRAVVGTRARQCSRLDPLCDPAWRSSRRAAARSSRRRRCRVGCGPSVVAADGRRGRGADTLSDRCPVVNWRRRTSTFQ